MIVGADKRSGFERMACACTVVAAVKMTDGDTKYRVEGIGAEDGRPSN